MTFESLRIDCEAAIARGPGHIYLVIEGPPPAGIRKRLFGKRGPYGEVCNYRDGRGTCCVFSAQKIIDYLNKIQKETE